MTLTRIFIVLESVSHEKLGNQTFFQPKNRWSPKKKKKKGLYRNWDWFFGPNRKFKRFFSPKTGGLQKKFFTKIETDFSAKIGNSNAFSYRITRSTSQLRHPISLRGGCFQFFTKNRPQKHQKHAILHTSQANAWLRYCTDQDAATATPPKNKTKSVYKDIKTAIYA